MEIKIKNKAGIKLLTADTLCEENIDITLDSSLIPSGTLDINENGIHDVEQYAQVNVEIQSGIDTSDATATAKDILLGKTAYVNNEKIVGIIEHYGGEYIIADAAADILPDEYIQLLYIESTGAQYIDTGVKLTNNHSVEIDYQLTDNNQKRAGLFGNLTSNATARYGSILSPTNSALEHGYGAGNVYWQQGTPDTNRHLLKQEKNKIYIDSILVYTFEQATFSISDSAPLGNFGYVNYTPAKAKYYGSRWWDGDTLVRDFIPCKRRSDNVTGMYDIVTNNFYINKGTETFIGG